MNKLRSDSTLSTLTPDQQVMLLNKLDQESYDQVIPWLKDQHNLDATPSMLSKFRSRQKALQTFQTATIQGEVLEQLAHSGQSLDLDNAKVDRMIFLPFELQAIEKSDFQTVFQIHRLLLDKRWAALKERQIALEEAQFHASTNPNSSSLSFLFRKARPPRQPRLKSKAAPASPPAVPKSDSTSPSRSSAASVSGAVSPDHLKSPVPAPAIVPSHAPVRQDVSFSLPPEVKSKVIAAVFPPPSCPSAAIDPLHLPEALLPENSGNYVKNMLRAKVVGMDPNAKPCVEMTFSAVKSRH